MTKSLQMMVGSCVVYVLVVACGPAFKAWEEEAEKDKKENPSKPSEQEPEVEGGGRGGEAAVVSNDGGKATVSTGGKSIVEIIVDPVPEVHANEDGTRLLNKYATSDGGLVHHIAGVYYDSERKEDCYLNVGTDGKNRCLPLATGHVTEYYADADCTKRLMRTSTCNDRPNYGRLGNTQSCAANSYAYYEVGAQHTLKLYKRDSGGDCTWSSANETQHTIYNFYHLGTEINPSEFVELTLINGEPG